MSTGTVNGFAETAVGLPTHSLLSISLAGNPIEGASKVISQWECAAALLSHSPLPYFKHHRFRFGTKMTPKHLTARVLCKSETAHQGSVRLRRNDSLQLELS
jgi:hypothetical protein